MPDKGGNREKRINNRHFDHIFLGFFLESGTFTTVFLIKFTHSLGVFYK